ncbi:FAD:protein FMN transferase [Litoreibacter janthinus]|uniref:FAD:protein FMN transferase n=1 Tax=Litoreibacter janthinus TaxID=670154 RepID=A0A1I6GDQ8_9RHOB|nr:FAD:protein FMN transferase [Litoreibacter janthinus]SFR40268.1 thiamine biosynthesis lipoprotein [Litoreibacter janthinus]
MLKMSIKPEHIALNGPTMGTRWSATFFAATGFDTAPVQAALQSAVDEVDNQMSTWKPDSDLMSVNAAPVGDWIPVPRRLLDVIRSGLEIGRSTEGAFDIGQGDAVGAWGFGPSEANAQGIKAAARRPRAAAFDCLEIDVSRRSLRKLAPVSLDLNGIAKGYGVDCMCDVLSAIGITSSLVAIDGELRATGLQPDGTAWAIAVEAPARNLRAAHSVVSLQDAAIATSGDYRHWVEIQGRRFSHTMHPKGGRPLAAPPASVTVVARTCLLADAWATALMVVGVDAGKALAERHGLDVLFLERGDAGEIVPSSAGRVFEIEQPIS